MTAPLVLPMPAPAISTPDDDASALLPSAGLSVPRPASVMAPVVLVMPCARLVPVMRMPVLLVLLPLSVALPVDVASVDPSSQMAG